MYIESFLPPPPPRHSHTCSCSSDREMGNNTNQCVLKYLSNCIRNNLREHKSSGGGPLDPPVKQYCMLHQAPPPKLYQSAVLPLPPWWNFWKKPCTLSLHTHTILTASEFISQDPPLQSCVMRPSLISHLATAGMLDLIMIPSLFMHLWLWKRSMAKLATC